MESKIVHWDIYTLHVTTVPTQRCMDFVQELNYYIKFMCYVFVYFLSLKLFQYTAKTKIFNLKGDMVKSKLFDVVV